jgi:hypothetical protein
LALTQSNSAQIKAFEERSAKHQEELKAARDEIDRLQTQIIDMVPRAELLTARQVWKLFLFFIRAVISFPTWEMSLMVHFFYTMCNKDYSLSLSFYSFHCHDAA